MVLSQIPGQPFFKWSWVGDHVDLIGQQLLEHVELTVLAVAIGLVISFPLGVVAYRRQWFYGPVTWVTGILYTIPSLALFVALQPITGLSTTSAEIGLVSYTLLILIRNIVTGLRGVPADTKEAARGMGYTDRQMLWKVELPLALPAILAGVRIATVTTIGLVTVTALIGKGGLGYLILQGFERFFQTETIVGGVLSIVLAVVADAFVLLAARLLTPWARRTRARSRAG